MIEPADWVAKFAISELITLYAALNDAGDWDAVASLYTEDGRMSRPAAPDDFFAGRGVILESFRARPPRAARHIVANVLVTLKGHGHASATSQILLFTGSPSADGGPPVLSASAPLVGTYRDQLIRTEQGWRFVERRGSLDFKATK
jgi:ketosteroid isomerase-like protein